MNIIILGLKPGQKVLARSLAKKLELKFVDTNDSIELLYFLETGVKVSSRQILGEIGLSLFKSLERKALLNLAHSRNTCIFYGYVSSTDALTLMLLKKVAPILKIKLIEDTVQLQLLPQEGKTGVSVGADKITVPIDPRNDDQIVDEAYNYLLANLPQASSRDTESIF